MTLSLIISLVFVCVLIAELWMGVAVISLYGDRLFVERKKHPGQYWLVMMVHLTTTIGLPVLDVLSR